MASSSLPVELWLEIFRWATLAPLARAHNAIEYHAFEAISAIPLGTDDASVCTLQAICLVCKQWFKWNILRLYKDIYIRSSCDSLMHVLQSGKDWGLAGMPSTPPSAALVRRAYLPFSSTATPTAAPPPALALLTLCSSLEILVRLADIPRPATYDYMVDCPPLPSLQRLDWWHSNAAAASGGINSLLHVLGAAPRLRYLSVGGEPWACFLHCTPPVRLPLLTTLRVRRANALLAPLLARCALPALRSVIVDTVSGPAEMLDPLWDAFGAQLRTLELGISMRFLLCDFLAHVLGLDGGGGGCTRLKELNYYVFFTQVPHMATPAAAANQQQQELETVGLHAHPNACFPGNVGSAEYWAHLRGHFEALSSTSTFPVLKRVLLHGDWSAVTHEEEFARATRRLRENGRVFEVSQV